MEAFKSTLLHTLELAVVVGAAVLIMKSLHLDSETTVGITTIVIGALAKFARASDAIPVKDFVNE